MSISSSCKLYHQTISSSIGEEKTKLNAVNHDSHTQCKWKRRKLQPNTCGIKPPTRIEGHQDFIPQPQKELCEEQIEYKFRGSILVQQQQRILRLEVEMMVLMEEIDKRQSVLDKLGLQQQKQECQENIQTTKSRYWTPQEHQRFLEALEKYGAKDVRSIALYVRTRTPTQVRTHAQKFYLRLQKHSDAADDTKDMNKKKERTRTRQTAMIVPPKAIINDIHRVT